MSILDDVEAKLDKVDAQAQLALDWMAEDKEFAKNDEYANKVYRWFAENKTSWRPELKSRVQYMIEQSAMSDEVLSEDDPRLQLTDLEKRFGKHHTIYSYGQPIFMMVFASNTGLGLQMLSKMQQLATAEFWYYEGVCFAIPGQADATPPHDDAKFVRLRLPSEVIVKEITSWPEWLIRFKHGEAVVQPPFRNLKLILDECWWPENIPLPNGYQLATDANMYLL